MTAAYQVLARKWRPRSFQEVVGQAPTVQALVNSLTQNRLHHAYLFTGTRGVGKTSIARLFAKCLNCQQGMTANPCGACEPCKAIDQGRFLDLIEVDAASRTKVEDTRDLLENVQYSPTLGRYKIYLIDEVHMLSNHSFNALLKTLEEPPPHVKFLLATTDPQKLPITVLSRCLQFHLKNLPAVQIAGQLAHILTQENITYEQPALDSIAHAAQGSMRDALSLLDQAVGHGNGKVCTDDVRDMLGATSPELLTKLLSALIEKNAASILDIILEIASSNVDFEHALEDLLSLLHQIALLQAVPALSQEQAPLREAATQLANRLSAEEIQLYYQIALMGRRDLPLAPSPRSGFEMILLRMLAFHPEPSTVYERTTTNAPAAIQAAQPTKTTTPKAAVAPTPAQPNQHIIVQPNQNINVSESSWNDLVAHLDLHGTALIVASHCACTKKTDSAISLVLDKQQAGMLNKSVEQRISEALNTYLGKPIHLEITVGQPTEETPMKTTQRKTQEAHSEAVESIAQDTSLHALIDAFDAQLLPSSVKSKKN